jgi:hypothetical protein
MTTFTTEDRILAEKDGSFTINVEGGTVSSPPHIVDSGASVMDNKPIAWMRLTGEKITTISPVKVWDTDIPLYTHPVKDLEDIDINITWNENSMRDFGKDELAFANAILRKAQEK